jgi:hypothetical protein
MLRTPRPIATLLAGIALLFSAVPALAAEPPAGVVLDATVTVIFTDPEDGGAALAGADVELVALRPDLGEDQVVQELAGQTDGDGRAVFTGVARAAEGAPPVSLEVDAHLDRLNSCGGTERLSGSAGAPAAPDVTIAVAVDGRASSCVAIPVQGTVLDPDGAPFAVAGASATVTYPDGDTTDPEVTVGPDGAFVFIVDGWLGGAAASAELSVTGESTTIEDPDTGCEQLVALVATDTWELPSPTQAPPPRALVAERVVISEACGSQGTPAPPAAPTLTLPPTDTVPSGTQGEASTGGPVGVLAVAFALLAALAADLTAAWAIRVSRRGS